MQRKDIIYFYSALVQAKIIKEEKKIVRLCSRVQLRNNSSYIARRCHRILFMLIVEFLEM